MGSVMTSLVHVSSRFLAVCLVVETMRDADELYRVRENENLGHDMSHVKLVVTGNLAHSDFLKLTTEAEDLVATTGDQSFIETLFLNKIPWYETMYWKNNFVRNVFESLQ